VILVIGATGKVGGSAVRHLGDGGHRVRALTRDPSKVATGPGLEAAFGDIDRAETLPPAMEGVDAVFLVAGGWDIPGEEANVIGAAEAAGVRHIVLCSSLGVEHNVASGPFHRPGEERLRASSLSWTILRPSVYMANALMWAESIKAQGVFYEPTGDGAHAMIHHDDIGAVAATVLTGDGHEGRTYELTGPAAVTAAQCAETLSAVLGRPVQHVDVSDEAFRAGMSASGAPEVLVDSLARYYAMVKAGDFAMVTATVPELVGRPGHTFENWATENVAAFG